jgi:hypothetical protein
MGHRTITVAFPEQAELTAIEKVPHGVEVEITERRLEKNFSTAQTLQGGEGIASEWNDITLSSEDLMYQLDPGTC